MNTANKLGVIMLFAMMTSASVSGQHYYGLGEKRPLFVDSGFIRVKFDAGLDLDARNNIYAGLPEIRGEIENDPNIDGFVTVSLDEQAEYATSMDALSGVQSVEMVEPFYLSPEGEPFVMG